MLKKNIIFILIMIFCGMAQPSQTDIKLLERADGYYNKGKYKKALILYQKVKKRQNNSHVLAFNIGNCYFRLEKLSEAAAAFKQSVRLSDGQYKSALFNLAAVLYKLKEYGESIATYHRALKMEPKNVNAWLFLGEGYLKTKDYVGAQRSLETAMRLDSTDVSMVYQLSEIYLKLEESDKAVELVNKAFLRHPEEVDFMFYLGDLYRSREDYSMAGEYYRKGLSFNPNNSRNLYKLADVLYSSEQPYLAVQALQKALDLKEDFSDAAVFLGNIAYELKWWQKAEDAYLLAVRKGNIEGVQGLRNMVYHFEKLGDIPKAILYLEKAYAAYPQDRSLEVELNYFKSL